MDHLCSCPLPRSFACDFSESNPPYYKCFECRKKLINLGYTIDENDNLQGCKRKREKMDN